MVVTETLSNIWPVLPALFTLVLILGASLKAAKEESALMGIELQPLTEALTVIIPARNEEERIGPTLRHLLSEASETLRVVVYDDRSSDGTAQIVRSLSESDSRLELIQGECEPAEGFGKPLALARATKEANPQTDCILYLDADVTLIAGTLGGLCARQRAESAVVSGCPELVCETPVEAMFVPAFVSLVAGKYAPSKVHHPDSSKAFLNGQLILVEQEALKAVGGFESVTHTVLEDVALAHRLKSHGFKLRLADLRGRAKTRMYTSWAEIHAGFGKNACALFGGPLQTTLLGTLSMLIAIGPLMGVVLSYLFGGSLSLFLSALIYALVMGIQFRMRRRMQVPAWPVLLVPFIYVGVLLTLAGAALTQLRGGTVKWKGRVYTAD